MRRPFHRWVPAGVRELANRAVGASTRYEGPFPDWQTARGQATGYDAPEILARVETATRHALSAPSLYEQDGTLRPRPAPASLAFDGLLIASARSEGRLRVLDVGGGLASHYLRWKPVLDTLPQLRWCILEQPAFAEAGGRLFARSSPVSFHTELAEAAAHRPNAILASSVLQYLEHPSAMLDALVNLAADVIVIDRTPFSINGDQTVLVQRVPKSLGGGSYPLQVLDAASVDSRLSTRYRKVLEFDAGDDAIVIDSFRAAYRGQIWISAT